MPDHKPLPLYRHGDVLIAQIAALPASEQLAPRHNTILARGEITGHSHRIAEAGAVQLWEQVGVNNQFGELFLQVTAEQATVVHEEHRPITLARGLYRVWMQREYHPTAIRKVVD
jgi:hypothetical protein